MEESSGELERKIQVVKHELKDNLSELEDKVKTTIDWRSQFEERPGTCLAVAFGGGILLSALLPRRRTHSRMRQSDGSSAESFDSSAADSSEAHDGKPGVVSELLTTLKAAAVGAAGGKIREFVEEFLDPSPDYRQNGGSYRRSVSPNTWQQTNSATSD